MAYIVTGGAGFIGSNIVRKLNENGINDVVIIDNYDETKMPNLVGLQFTDYIDFTDGLAVIKDKLDKIDHPQGVFHIGANADVLEYDAKKMMIQNFEFSKLYCEFATENRIPFIYASSSAVYGNSKNQAAGLDDVLPHNIYAWSKWLFDKYTTNNVSKFTNKVIGFRFFNVFGWGEFHKGKNANIVYRFYRFIKDKGFIDLFRDEIIRDHVWVGDLAEVLYQAMISDKLKTGIYNLGGNHPISHHQVAEIVVNTMMDEGVIEKKDTESYIKLVDMPAELRAKFQFYTHAEKQEEFISRITTGNDLKMGDYVRSLIKKNK